ncbi:MAG TPA: hypothetical protein PK059_02015 [Cyclobacteriaceae bacterium]|nr:hypothetical protein [Cyclobacteriaceae bacterium]
MEDVGYDFLAKIKRGTGSFKSGGVYWCGSKFIRFDPYIADTYPSTLIPPFVDQKKLLIVRGGIGDLLALSVLGDVAEEVHVVTTRGLFHVLDWWEHTPRRKHFNEPLFQVKYPKKIEDYCREFGQQTGDHIIAQGSRENWYDIIAKSVNKPFLGGRPVLKQGQKAPILGVNRLQKMSILVVNKATSVNRSGDLTAILSAIPPGFAVYWYDSQQKLNGVGKETTIQQYLSDLYYADFVISVDTSAIHFREGINKPALGLYSSFSAESRTRYYHATQSMDIKSPCTIQPCFYNKTKCPVMMEGDDHAPCLGPDNLEFAEQIREKLKQML